MRRKFTLEEEEVNVRRGTLRNNLITCALHEILLIKVTESRVR
jgi:hypothetical protein